VQPDCGPNTPTGCIQPASRDLTTPQPTQVTDSK
jgi:hypothetical protein